MHEHKNAPWQERDWKRPEYLTYVPSVRYDELWGKFDNMREAILAFDDLAPDDPAFLNGSAWRSVMDTVSDS